MHNKNNDFVIALFIILGVVISLQARTIFKESEKWMPIENRYEKLKMDLNKEKNNVAYYMSEIAEKEKTIKEYEKLAGKRDAGVEQLRLELESLKVMAGLTDVIGPGVIITLDDSKVLKDDVFNRNESIIHDLDIIVLLNELKIAGAEAISINNERITSTSEQVCAGPTIRINNSRQTIPFTILAIGNRESFRQKFKTQSDLIETHNTVINMLKDRGIVVDIKYSNSIRISKYKGSIYPLIGRKEGS